MLPHFSEEIMETLSKSGRTFGEDRFGDITVLYEKGRDFSVIAVPISERTLEDAARKSKDYRNLILGLSLSRKTVGEIAAKLIGQDLWLIQGSSVMFLPVTAMWCE